MIPFTIRIVIISTIILFYAGNKAVAQEKKEYDYLVNCFKNSKTDTSEIEIDGIGTVTTIDISSQEIEETGLTYFTVPANKQNKPSTKLAAIVADNQVKTWKNNSRVIVRESYKVGEASIIDLRLHMLIENIYMQVIVVSEKDKIYQVMCFRDTNEKAWFDGLVKSVKEKKCF